MKRKTLFRILVIKTILCICFYYKFTIMYDKTEDQTYEQLMKEAEQDMIYRKNLLETMCKKYKLNEYLDVYYKTFYIDTQHNFTYCPLCKVASTTWQHQMLRMKNYSDEFLTNIFGEINIFARKLFPNPNLEILSETTIMKLIIVRHPFERLVSAYRDKLQNKTNREFYYETYGKLIVFLFRQQNSSQTQIEPTFAEFIQYIISNSKFQLMLDLHWMPMYLQCPPCLIGFNVIAHLETFNRDQLYLFKIFQVENLMKPNWKHLTREKQTDKDLTKQYMANISNENILKLYHIYKFDFELFGYDYLEYYVNLTTM